jgi:hypothetical protein
MSAARPKQHRPRLCSHTLPADKTEMHDQWRHRLPEHVGQRAQLGLTVAVKRQREHHWHGPRFLCTPHGCVRAVPRSLREICATHSPTARVLCAAYRRHRRARRHRWRAPPLVINSLTSGKKQVTKPTPTQSLPYSTLGPSRKGAERRGGFLKEGQVRGVRGDGKGRGDAALCLF